MNALNTLKTEIEVLRTGTPAIQESRTEFAYIYKIGKYISTLRLRRTGVKKWTFLNKNKIFTGNKKAAVKKFLQHLGREETK